MCGKQPLGTVFHTCDGKQQLKQIRTVDRGGRPLKMGLGPFFQKMVASPNGASWPPNAPHPHRVSRYMYIMYVTLPEIL